MEMEISQRIHPVIDIPLDDTAKLGNKIRLLADYEVIEVDDYGVRLRLNSISPLTGGRTF